jgi:hypothetical protein
MLFSICQWIENSAVGQFISGSTWAFPAIESIHVFFLVIVVGTIAIVDFRLLGVASKNRSVSQLSNDVLPITWTAFVMALITGSLLFSSRATHYLANWPFRFKIILFDAGRREHAAVPFPDLPRRQELGPQAEHPDGRPAGGGPVADLLDRRGSVRALDRFHRQITPQAKAPWR